MYTYPYKKGKNKDWVAFIGSLPDRDMWPDTSLERSVFFKELQGRFLFKTRQKGFNISKVRLRKVTPLDLGFFKGST